MRFWQDAWINCFSVAEITSDLLFALPLSIQQKGTVDGALTLGRWINNIKALISIAKFMPVLNVLGVLKWLTLIFKYQYLVVETGFIWKIHIQNCL